MHYLPGARSMTTIKHTTRWLAGMKVSQTGLFAACVVFLTACSSGPPPKLYLLDSPAQGTVAVELAKKADIQSLGMSPVTLPGYANDAQIASLNIDGTISQNDRHRWAEDPDDALTRVLSERLRAHADTTVLIEPWPRDYAPIARVEVSFDKLLREPSGGALMVGQILLLSGNGRTLLKAVPFNLSLAAVDESNQAFFAAVARGVDDIARLAVEQIQSLSAKA